MLLDVAVSCLSRVSPCLSVCADPVNGAARALEAWRPRNRLRLSPSCPHRVSSVVASVACCSHPQALSPQATTRSISPCVKGRPWRSQAPIKTPRPTPPPPCLIGVCRPASVPGLPHHLAVAFRPSRQSPRPTFSRHASFTGRPAPASAFV